MSRESYRDFETAEARIVVICMKELDQACKEASLNPCLMDVSSTGGALVRHSLNIYPRRSTRVLSAKHVAASLIYTTGRRFRDWKLLHQIHRGKIFIYAAGMNIIYPAGRYDISRCKAWILQFQISTKSLGSVTRRIKQGQYRLDARTMSIPQVLPRLSRVCASSYWVLKGI